MPRRDRVDLPRIWPSGSPLWAKPARSVCRALAAGPKATGDVLAAVKSDGVAHALNVLCWAEIRGFVRYYAGRWALKKCPHCAALVTRGHACDAERWAALA